MTMPSRPPHVARVWDDPRIVVPGNDVWMAMSPDERDEAFERIRAVFEEHREAMAEGVIDDRSEALDEVEPRRADVLDRLARAQAAVTRMLLELCRLRGIVLTPEQHTRLISEHDLDALGRWAERAPTVATADELLSDTP